MGIIGFVRRLPHDYRLLLDRLMTDFRIEKDSLGEVKVPKDALYGAQTQRAVENFPVSGIRFPRIFIRALGLIKAVCAEVNAGLGLLDANIANAIHPAIRAIAATMTRSAPDFAPRKPSAANPRTTKVANKSWAAAMLLCDR